MDRKLKSILFLLLVLIGLGSCKVNKKSSEPIIQECKIENDKAIIIINRKRIRYNKLNYVIVGAVCHPEKVEEIENQLIITALTENIVDFKQGNTYEIEIYWFGGHILASGIYNDGSFEIIEERVKYT